MKWVSVEKKEKEVNVDKPERLFLCAQFNVCMDCFDQFILGHYTHCHQSIVLMQLYNRYAQCTNV